jgi:hypothetical protein
MRSEGSFRQWTNGNLQVLLEPTETGHRLRFRTVHGAARDSIRVGFVAVAAAAVTAIATAVSGHAINGIPGVAFLFITGGVMIANGAVRLPRWARLRQRQMDALAEQVALPASAPEQKG